MASAAADIARRAKAAFDEAQASLPGGAEADAARSEALLLIRDKLQAHEAEVRAANAQDMEAANAAVAAGKLSRSLVARLDLFSKPGKWAELLEGLAGVAALPSPLDHCTYSRRLADATATAGALDLYRVTCPIGVLLCIFEARPEVVVNIASLAIKSGNAAILKGGRESVHTAGVLTRLVAEALGGSRLPRDLVQSVQSRDEVAALLDEDRFVDLVIPRGSNELVRAIQRDARMPVMGHADGLCAVYVHDDADEATTVAAVVDAKIDYPAACNAVETLLLHRSHLSGSLWPALAKALLDAGVELRCDPDSLAALGSAASSRTEQVKAATAEDFETEFLSLTLAVETVDGVTEAVSHINTHGSHHTDAIFCAPLAALRTTPAPSEHPAAAQFTRAVASANVFVNASTRFADGFRYGFGTEVGISTGRTHARGPVGLEGLVIYKYIARAEGAGPQKAGEFGPEKRAWAHTDIERRYPRF